MRFFTFASINVSTSKNIIIFVVFFCHSGHCSYFYLSYFNKKLSWCWDSSRYDISDSGRLTNRNRNPKYVIICKFYFTDRIVKRYLQSADIDGITWESYSVVVAIKVLALCVI